MYLRRVGWPSLIVVPNAGKRLLEMVARFLTSPLDARRTSSGEGALPMGALILVPLAVVESVAGDTLTLLPLDGGRRSSGNGLPTSLAMFSSGMDD